MLCAYNCVVKCKYCIQKVCTYNLNVGEYGGPKQIDNRIQQCHVRSHSCYKCQRYIYAAFRIVSYCVVSLFQTYYLIKFLLVVNFTTICNI